MLDHTQLKTMSTRVWKVWSILLFVLPVLSVDPIPYSYSWQENPGSSNQWGDLDSVFGFQSQRIRPVANDNKNSGYKYLTSMPETPSSQSDYIRNSDYKDYGLVPEFGPGGINIVPSPDLTKESSDFRPEVDISQERMGGFGGTGDTLGYGAFEYKSINSNDNNDIYDKNYESHRRTPKTRGTFMDGYLNGHPLQTL